MLEVALIKDRATGAQRGQNPFLTARSGGTAGLARSDGHRSGGTGFGWADQAAVSSSSEVWRRPRELSRDSITVAHYPGYGSQPPYNESDLFERFLRLPLSPMLSYGLYLETRSSKRRMSEWEWFWYGG